MIIDKADSPEPSTSQARAPRTSSLHGGAPTTSPASASQIPAHMRYSPTAEHDLEGDDLAPPPYHVDYSTLRTNGGALAASAAVGSDGRVSIGLLEKLSLPRLSTTTVSLPVFGADAEHPQDVPPLAIVMFIVGSRGDVQPFIPLAHGLQKVGHRVRIATHETFRDLVLGEGIEFFDIGGDPADLMAYMVKNPGLLPGFDSLRRGDIPRKRKMIREILEGCWRACYEPDPVSGQPFAADAIIANPPSFAHIHVAEALSIPLHIVFTMPWVSTQAFPHPLVNISREKSSVEPGMGNFLSYALVDLLTWQGLGDVINSFRKSTLGLSPLGLRSGSLILERLRIPTSFCWSPTLIPKPKDYADHIDVTGFTFFESQAEYSPPAELEKFLRSGDPPIYIGFGSVPVKDPKLMTEIIFTAVRSARVRAIVSSGWAKLGEGFEVPEEILIVGNVPHDWLFKHVKAAVHHGGAGTTAIAVKEGKPSLVVPFFGDQPFWGEMIAKAGAGPQPISPKGLTAMGLAEAIEFLVKPETLKAAQKLGEQIREEDGVQAGVESFQRNLPLLNMRCDVDRSQAACWWHPTQYLRLSPFVTQVLADAHKLDITALRPHRVKTYTTRVEFTDPLSGVGVPVLRLIFDYTSSFGEIFVSPVSGLTKNVTAFPLAMVNIVGGISEGFRNLPTTYGSRARRVGEIRGWKSGMKEAGKGLYFGMYDGLTGLVTEPYQAAKEEGGVGFLKGSARSVGNLVIKPGAGAFGLVEHSFRGLWRSAEKHWTPQRQRLSSQAEARELQGIAAVANSTPAQREAILSSWDALTSPSVRRERKTRIKKEVAAWYRGMEEAGLAEAKENIVGEMRKGGFEADDNQEEEEGDSSRAATPEQGEATPEQGDETPEQREEREHEREEANWAAREAGRDI